MKPVSSDGEGPRRSSAAPPADSAPRCQLEPEKNGAPNFPSAKSAAGPFQGFNGPLAKAKLWESSTSKLPRSEKAEMLMIS